MKTRVDDLAILGGQPSFTTPLHVGRPNIGDRDRLRERIEDILDRRWLTNDGPYVKEFEERIAATIGVKHCIATCNATSGLEILLRASDITADVIVPSFTFVATAHAVEWLGCTPVFCDVDRSTHTISVERLSSLLTPNTRAIIGVHLWGRPCAIEELEDFAARHRLLLFFDAAHAFGGSHRGRMLGTFGAAEVFSFHATKFINAFEGGAIVTNDDRLAERLRLMRNFGFVGYDQVDSVGINGKMSEASAAMGLTSLDAMDQFIATNRGNYEAYRAGLAGVPGLTLVRYDERERSNYQYVVAEVDRAAAGLSADQLVAILTAENVLVRRYFRPGCHRMEPYRSRPPQDGYQLPNTEYLADRTVALPTGAAVDHAAIAQICWLIRFATDNAAALRQVLGKVAGAES